MDAHHLNVDPSSDRLPQWTLAETRELVAARAELDASFMETKRNRLLWDLVSSKMKEKGFHRSAEQCKCKWKNLVTRYKGSETMDPESARQLPFHAELRVIFDARMQRLMWLAAAEGEAAQKKKAVRSYSDDDDSLDEEAGTDQKPVGGSEHRRKSTITKKKRKMGGAVAAEKGGGRAGASGSSRGMVEMLEEFLNRQARMEMEWCKEEEVREAERTAKEMEWRQAMAAIERERMTAEQRWRELEELRWAREEARMERRDALVTALLDKLWHGDP